MISGGQVISGGVVSSIVKVAVTVLSPSIRIVVDADVGSVMPVAPLQLTNA